MNKILGTLIERRKRIIDAGTSGEAVFYWGKDRIILKKDSLAINDTVWKLPKKEVGEK